MSHSISSIQSSKGKEDFIAKYSTIDKFNTQYLNSQYQHNRYVKTPSKKSSLVNKLNQINDNLLKQNRNLQMQLWKYPFQQQPTSQKVQRMIPLQASMTQKHNQSSYRSKQKKMDSIHSRISSSSIETIRQNLRESQKLAQSWIKNERKKTVKKVKGNNYVKQQTCLKKISTKKKYTVYKGLQSVHTLCKLSNCNLK